VFIVLCSCVASVSEARTPTLRDDTASGVAPNLNSSTNLILIPIPGPRKEVKCEWSANGQGPLQTPIGTHNWGAKLSLAGVELRGMAISHYPLEYPVGALPIYACLLSNNCQRCLGSGCHGRQFPFRVQFPGPDCL